MENDIDTVGRCANCGVEFHIHKPEPEPQKINLFWYIIHNALAHPLLLTHSAWADHFHDWIVNKI